MRKEIADREINSLKEKLIQLGYKKNEIVEIVKNNIMED